MRRFTLTAMLVLSALPAFGRSRFPLTRYGRGPEIWLAPNAQHVMDLLDDTKRWDFTRRGVSGLKLYIGTLAKTPKEQLVRLASLARRNRWRITVECAGCGNPDWGDQAGEKTAEVETRSFKRWISAGGRIDFLDMDGPVRRLMGHGGWGRDPDKRFTSYERAAGEVTDYMRSISRQIPGVRFFLLTNFPNWGYKGGVSYHGRGKKKQDWGDYFDVLTAVLEKTQAARLPLAGVTVDNPYEYLVGEHRSAALPDPKEVDWVKRVRNLEDFVHSKRLAFNLIVNSELGGKTSDAEFKKRTLAMVKTYLDAGGRPDRLIVQSWYKYPVTVLPESSPDSMTALVKDIIVSILKGRF